jgi:hypothetical protein
MICRNSPPRSIMISTLAFYALNCNVSCHLGISIAGLCAGRMLSGLKFLSARSSVTYFLVIHFWLAKLKLYTRFLFRLLYFSVKLILFRLRRFCVNCILCFFIPLPAVEIGRVLIVNLVIV